MRSAAPATSRGRSRSSSRSSQRPPCARASRKLAPALYREPKCRSPEGVGAKRPTYGGVLAVPVVAVAVLLFAAFAPLLSFHREGGDGSGFQPLDADMLSGLGEVIVGSILAALQRLNA